MARVRMGDLSLAGLRRLVGVVRTGASHDVADDADTTAFSIVLPIYDSNPQHLAEQLEAIGEQTLGDWECLVVDDGSTDPRGVEVARHVAARDERFTLHLRAANGGIAAATNDGLARAGNPWIVFCDHDDLLSPGALAAVAEHIATHPTDDLIYTDEELIAEDGSHIVEYRKPDFSPERLLGQNYICHLVAVRRSLVEQIGGLDATYEPVADYDFDMRAADAARHVGHIPTILYGWRSSPGSLAASGDAKGKVAEGVLASAAAHIERRGLDARAAPGPDGPTLVRISRPSGGHDVEQLPLHAETTAGQLDELLRETTAPFVAITPAGAPEGWYEPLVAICAQPQVAAAGPKLVTSDARLVSAGRVHHPGLTDLFQGIEADNPGPWGAFCVNREVASVAAAGAVLDRAAVLRLGGLEPATLVGTFHGRDCVTTDHLAEVTDEMGLDLAMAMLGTALWRRGTPVIWTPLRSLTVDGALLRTGEYWTRLAEAQREWARSFPDLLADPYSPVGVRR